MLLEDARRQARALAAQLRTENRPVVVNVGGEGEEPNAINLNFQNRLRFPIDLHVEAMGEDIGELFEPDSVDEIVSNRLPPNTFDWNRLIPGAHRVLRRNGRITIRFQGTGQDAATIEPALRRAKFRDIKNYRNAAFEAVK